MERLEYLLNALEEKADKIFREELDKIKYDEASLRIFPLQSVGVQGDMRTYGFPVEIEIIYNKGFVWDEEEFIRNLSNRITNEVKVNYSGEDFVVNKVLYSLREG